MFVADFNAANMHFEKASTGSSGQKQVLVYKDGSSTRASNRIEFQLSPDVTAPVDCKFPLDTVKEGENPLRRGQKFKLTEPQTLAALAAIDEKIIATAIERSAEWFGKTLPADQIRARYQPIAEVKKDGDDHHTMKMTVKMPGSRVPTQLHLMEPSGKVRKHGGRAEHLELRCARVVAVVSAYSIYFLGAATQFGLAFQAEKLIITPGVEDDGLAGFVSSKPIECVSDAAAPSATKEEEVELVDDYAAM